MAAAPASCPTVRAAARRTAVAAAPPTAVAHPAAGVSTTATVSAATVSTASAALRERNWRSAEEHDNAERRDYRGERA